MVGDPTVDLCEARWGCMEDITLLYLIGVRLIVGNRDRLDFFERI